MIIITGFECCSFKKLAKKKKSLTIKRTIEKRKIKIQIRKSFSSFSYSFNDRSTATDEINAR